MGFFDAGVRHHRNYMCHNCYDTGWVLHWVFWRKTCPQCNGDPRSQLPPKPDPPPAPPRKVI